MTIKIITLPPSRWQENKALRLQALKNDPAFFRSTYEEDAALADSRWIAWLKEAETGSCYLLFAEKNDSTLIGMVGATLNVPEQTATIIALYVDPHYRGQKIGKQLLDTLLAMLNNDTRVTKYTLCVNKNAYKAIALYESAGFKKINQENDCYIMEKLKPIY